MGECIVCKNKLSGKQTKYCSNSCKFKTQNTKHQNYVCQQRRGETRKKKLVVMAGGECCKCGYKKNYSALQFHHKNPEEKKFGIDLRRCSNTKWETLVEEFNKCELLCANCHAEHHNPECLL